MFRGTNIIEKVICLDTENMLTERGGQPIFYMRVGRIMRLAQKIVKVAGIVTRNEPEKGAIERRSTNLMNGEKVSCHGE